MAPPLTTKAFDLRLLKLVKENPILYNMKDLNYVSFDAREVVWQKIGDELNKPAHLCKSRWANIRDMMRRKLRLRLTRPNDIKAQYKYRYEKELAFMIPYFKEITALPGDYSDCQQDDDCDDEITNEVFMDTSIDYEQETKPDLPLSKSSEETSRDLTETVLQELNPTDPLDVFLLTIAATMRKLSPYYLNQAKTKIFQVVQDYELQQIVDSGGQPGTSESVAAKR